MDNQHQSCKDANVLDTKINSLTARQDNLERRHTDDMAELKSLIKDLTDAVKNQMDSLTKQTNTQEVRLTVIETATSNQEKRIDGLEGTVMKHGNRLAQVAIAAVFLSILLPVAFEVWITEPSEIRPIPGNTSSAN